MFVDIGSKRDGLVHVKDISKDYFINNHQSVRPISSHIASQTLLRLFQVEDNACFDESTLKTADNMIVLF
jgi:Ribonuclease G/E